MFPSGLVVPETRRTESIPEVMTTSGYALLHFFSDAAYNLTGFNIFYSYVKSQFETLSRYFSSVSELERMLSSFRKTL